MHNRDYSFDLDAADFILKSHLELVESIQENTVQLIQKVRKFPFCLSVLYIYLLSCIILMII